MEELIAGFSWPAAGAGRAWQAIQEVPSPLNEGALPIRLDAERVAALRALLHARPGATLTIDLPAQTVLGPDGRVDRFDIDPFRKACLLEGVDEISLTLGYADEIARFEARRRQAFDWL